MKSMSVLNHVQGVLSGAQIMLRSVVPYPCCLLIVTEPFGLGRTHFYCFDTAGGCRNICHTLSTPMLLPSYCRSCGRYLYAPLRQPVPRYGCSQDTKTALRQWWYRSVTWSRVSTQMHGYVLHISTPETALSSGISLKTKTTRQGVSHCRMWRLRGSPNWGPVAKKKKRDKDKGEH